jgi:hypothetical protein
MEESDDKKDVKSLSKKLAEEKKKYSQLKREQAAELKKAFKAGNFEEIKNIKKLMKDIKKAFLKKTLNLKAQKKSVEKSVSKRSFFDEKVIEKKLKEQKRKFESIKRLNEEELKEARKSGDYKKVQEIKNVIRELKKSFKVASNNLESKKILLTRSNLKNLSIKTEEDKRKLAREIKLSKQKYRDLKNELQFELKEALKSGNKEEMNRIKRELNKIRNMYKEEAR